MSKSRLRFTLPALAAAALVSTRVGEVKTQAAATASASSSGFKITFGLKQKAHGRVWSGGVRDRAQIRSIRGWHLDASDSIVPPNQWNITLASIGGDVASKAVILDLVSPEEQPVTVSMRDGDFTFVPAEIPYGKPHFVAPYQGDVSIERAPVPQTVSGPEFDDDDPALLRTRSGEYWLAWVAYKTRARDEYRYKGADQVMVARGRDGRLWSSITTLTPPGDHFRVALGEDRQGRIWCVYSLQKQMETGNFDLYGRVFDGTRWSDEQQLTTSPLPDVFHKLATDRNGNLFLAWMGFRPGAGGGPAQSDILMRVLTGDKWSDEINVSQSPEDDWEPAIAADDTGRAWVAWDSYRAAGKDPATYDILLRSYSGGTLSAVEAVSSTPLAEMRADVAVDGAGRVCVAWEEGGANWGKDNGYQNPKHRINLRPGGSRLYGPANSLTARYRPPRIAIREGGRWLTPTAPLERSYPEFMQSNLFQNPRLGTDSAGNVWLFLRHQVVAKGRWTGQLFDYYATTLAGPAGSQRWLVPVSLPGTTGRQDTVLATAPADGGIAVAAVGDGRRFPVPLPINHDISTMVLNAPDLPRSPPEVAAFQPSQAGGDAATHPDEARQVAQVRNHRVTVGGKTYKIVRGDTHRHTEISMDGAVDGSLWDLYRYALNAAAFDFVGVTEHNYGAWLDTDEPETKNTDSEFQWWRIQKSADIFHVPGRFMPLYGYERSINFPLGHRNIFHARRGVFSYRVPKLHISERPELIEKDAQGLWAYLRATDGIGIAHTPGTGMGTDWRLRDDELEPVTEIYQGCRNAYEDEGQPRAALPNATGDGGAGRSPFQKGLVWNALGVGYRMGFVASSDHFSTHISYANLLVPDRVTTRDDIQDAFRARRTYGATDNIIVDFYAGSAMQGAEMVSSQSPAFRVKAVGTEPLLKVEVIKNNRVVYSRSVEPGAREVQFSFRDAGEFGGNFADTTAAPTSQIRNWERPETGIRPRPSGKDAYYYVRVIQRYSAAQPETEGEIAWSSPIFVRQ